MNVFSFNNLNDTQFNPQYNLPVKESNYFKQCSIGSVMWGSNKPIDEKCPTDYIPHKGEPCHSIWNNSTKRKTIINR